MSNRALLEIVGGILLGTAMAAALVFGILELADAIMEVSDELSRAG